MKLILPILILTCLIATSCKKEEQHCWQCSYTYTGSLPDSTGDTVLCHFTQTDIKLRQDKEFGTSVAGYTKWGITNCQQQ